MSNENDLSGKVGLDITDFKANIVALSREARVIESDFRATATGMDDWSSSSDGLQARIKALTGLIDVQKQKVEKLQAMYTKITAEKGESSKAAQDMQIKINNETAALNRNQLELQNVTTKLDNFETETRQAADATEDATKKGSLLGKIFAGGFFANIATNALSAIKNKLKEVAMEGLGLASDLTEVKNVVDTTFGKDAGKIDIWAKKAASAFGLSELNAKKFNGTLGAMLKSAGIVGDELTEMSTDLVGVAADFGSFYNLDVQDSFDKIRQAIGGQSDGLKQLGIDLNQNNIMQTEYARSLNKTWNEMTSAEQATARYKAILELGADALGDFSKTSDSYANKLKILGLEFDNLKLAIGERLLPIANKVVTWLTDLISGGDTAAESMKKLSNNIEETNSIDDLIRRYETLTSRLKDNTLSESMAAKMTAELEQVKQDLIEASGGVITAIDEENGTFDQQVDVLKTANETQREYLKYKLLAVLYENNNTKSIEKHQAALDKYNKKLADQNEMQARYNDLLNMSTEAQDEANEGVTGYQEQLDILGAALEKAKRNTADAAEQLSEIVSEASEVEQAAISLVQNGLMPADEVAKAFGISLADLNMLIWSQTTNLTDLDAAALQYGMTINDLMFTVGLTSQAQKEYEAQKQSEMETYLSLRDRVSSLGDEISALQADYNAAKVAAQESLTQTLGLWNEMDTKAKTSVKDVQGALKSQVDWLTEYNDNLTALASREIPEVDTTQLVQSLSDGSTESAEILAGLATATDEEIANIVDLMGGISEGKENLSETMAELNTDFQNRMDEISQKVADTVDEMNNSGEAGIAARNTMNGYIAATYGMIPKLEDAYEEAARRANQAYRNELQIKSPSRVAMEGTEQYFIGHILEAAIMTPAMAAAYAKNARAANDAARKELSASLRQHLIYSAETGGSSVIGGRGYSGAGAGMAMVYSILDGKVISATLSPIQYDNNNSYERALGRILA